MQRRDDSDEIRRKLNDEVEGVLNKLAPGWKRRGKTAYLTPKNDKDLGSFTVSLSDQNRLKRGGWYRFSQKEGGGMLELISYLRNAGRKNDYKDAFDWARTHLGMQSQSNETEQEKQERQDRDQAAAAQRRIDDEKHAAQVEQKKEQRKASAAEVWAQTVPINGTHGEDYLVARGLPPISEWPWDPVDTIRFHPALDFEPDRDIPLLPAVVCKVVDVFGDLVAVWQIYLHRTKPKKANLSPSPKIGRGPATGGAVRIGGEGEHIGAAEGLETSLAAWFLESCRYPVWSMLSTSGVAGFEIPMEVKRITGWPDGDFGVLQAQTGAVLEPPGISAQRALEKRTRDAGKRFHMNEMCQDGDALDLWETRQKIEKGRNV